MIKTGDAEQTNLPAAMDKNLSSVKKKNTNKKTPKNPKIKTYGAVLKEPTCWNTNP